jgi:hypothetical protein
MHTKHQMENFIVEPDEWWELEKASFKEEMAKCRNPTLAKCGGEAQHLEKARIWSPSGLPNV